MYTKNNLKNQGFYFRKDDTEHIAEIMKAIWLNPVAKKVNPEELLSANRKRQERLGKDFLQCCRDAIRLH